MAETCGNFEYSVEIHFAQRLASNEKKIRDKAVKRLRQWIVARSKKENDFEEVELLKLWKGLYYCMWMSDKPVIQEELADEIADIIHCFQKPAQAIPFFGTFMLTMKREWMGIDHLRMDKYLMFIRRCFRQMLVLLHNNEWDEQLLESFLNALRRTALDPAEDSCPDGLRYHIINVYLDELAREGTEELTPQQATSFLVPFCELAVKTQNKKLRDVVLQDIFQDVIERSNVGEEEEEEEDEGIASDEDWKKKVKSGRAGKKQKRGKKKDAGGENGDEEEESSDEDDVDILAKVMFPEEMVPPLEYDYGAIADKLFELASQKDVTNRNRKPVYKMVQRLRTLAKGVYPMPNILEQIRNDPDEDYLEDELPWWKTLQTQDKDKDKKKKRKRKRRKRKGQQNDEGDDGDDDEDDGDEDGDEVKRKKVKMTRSGDGVMEKENKDEDEENVREDGKRKVKSSKRKQTKERNQSQSILNDFEKQEEEVKDFSGKVERSKKGKATDNGIDERTPSGDVKMKRTKRQKKNRDEDPDIASLNQVDIGDVSPDASSVSQSDSDPTSEGKMAKKAKLKKKKKQNLVGDNASNSEDGHQATETAEKMLDDGSEAKLNLRVTGKKKKSKADLGQMEESATSAPFASFKKVVTPPPALVKKSIAMATGEATTLPRAKPKTRVAPKYTPPMTRKRVKIALSKNQVQAAQDYKQRIKLSPGVPFDGTKKPTHSVLKQTPEKSESTTPSIIGKKKTKRKRSKAADFF